MDDRSFVALQHTLIPDAARVHDTNRLPAREFETHLAEKLGILGSSPAIQALRAKIRRVGPSHAPVLVLGETGVGKELVARAVHDCGPSAGPFVAVNAATLRGTLFQSELFGHERGAFTGAIARRRGLFEQASGGTLFVDEIGDLDLGAQAELLRVLETGEVRALGAERVRKVRVRLVAATNRSLASLVEQRTFRADLYHRLRGFVLFVPPLRDRIDDLPILVEGLLRRLKTEIGERALTREAHFRLADHDWSGNVRELLHVLLRAAVLSDARVLDDAHIVAALAPDPEIGSVSPFASVAIASQPSDDAIRTALQLSNGSIKGAARALGIARSTLRDRLARSKMKPD